MCTLDPSNGQFAAIKSFVEHNLSSALTIHSLCRHFGIGRNNLAALFRQHTGMPPRQYIIATRMRKAADLMQQQQKIVVVARQTGYQNIASFIRAYKQYHGTTPAGTNTRSK